ncbi:RNA-directed DNA polymerase from mobile element jockey [Trichonephila clavipes]|uniref:RNA-directed DNA polymerase from mobile element jockey n=1 Tax=Trichonephila clavipes TaxID=2585209 RepID=A0A8X6WBI1_TRICX|nr:RNA-directed DNA polymerase from mobile element jockey [Trichonephila clavipes]
MFLVQETWLEPGIDPQIANYRLTKDDRIEFPHTVTRGGTAIYCKNEIVHHRVPLPNLQGMDATAVQIKINNFPPINVVSAYVRRRVGHSFPVEDFKKIFNSGSNCIIAGDYNAAHVSWHNAKSTRFGQVLHRLVRDLRGAKLVAPQTATHLQSRQRFGKVIDLAVFKHIPFNHSVRVINDLSSDHYPVILEINLITSIIKNPEQLSTNWFNFKFALNKKPLPTDELTSNDNIELRKFWQRTRCPSIYSQFRTLSREIAKDIQAYSRVQWEKHIEALSPVDNTLWRKSSLLRKPFQSIPPLKGALGSITITPIEKAEVIADSLQAQFEPNHVAGRELFDQRIHDEVTNFINTPHVHEIEPTTPTEVLSYVQRLKPRKSPGLDQISNLRVDKTLSSPRPIRSGLPQGSLSSPLLFDSRFGRCGDMTSIPNWSEMTDSTVQPAANIKGLGASPSQTTIGDDHIAENSDVFREAIKARNIYAAWARKLTNAKPSDPDVQTYHMEVKKAGETVETLLVKLNVPLFKIPASEKELDKIVFRVKNRPVVSTPPKNQEAEKPAAVPPPPSNSPRKTVTPSGGSPSLGEYGFHAPEVP